MVKRRKSFTMIELIAVIAILGILAVVAIPQYVDLKGEAAEAQADGVYGAAQGAASMSFAANVAGKSPHNPITSANDLVGKMEEKPAKWNASGNDLSATISNTTYTISIDSAETSDSKAKLSKDW